MGLAWCWHMSVKAGDASPAGDASLAGDESPACDEPQQPRAACVTDAHAASQPLRPNSTHPQAVQTGGMVPVSVRLRHEAGQPAQQVWRSSPCSHRHLKLCAEVWLAAHPQQGAPHDTFSDNRFQTLVSVTHTHSVGVPLVLPGGMHRGLHDQLRSANASDPGVQPWHLVSMTRSPDVTR